MFPRLHSGLLFLLIAAGCSCEEEVPPANGLPIGSVCDANAVCQAELTCRDQRCSETCVPETTACALECCASTELCTDGACAPEASCTGARVVCASACCAAGQACVGEVCCGAAATCGQTCCGANEICELGQCKRDCGAGMLGCGTQQVCCAGTELCHGGQCVTPGRPCGGGSCATRFEETGCEADEYCDPAVGFCLKGDVNQDCVYVPPSGVFQPVPLFTWGARRARACVTDDDCQTAEVCTAGTCAVTWRHIAPAADDFPDHVQSVSIPIVIDLDQDCVPEIVFNTYQGSLFTADGVLRAIRGDTGAKVWTVTATAYRTDSTANPAAGDLDGDGVPEVLVAGQGKQVLCFNADGTPRWTSDVYAGPEGSGSVAIANLDGEGEAEVIFGAAVFDHRGRLLYEGALGSGMAGQGPISCVADLDGDGRPELVGGNTAYAFDGTVRGATFSGQERWTSTAPDGYCGVADLTGDGAPEVVLVSTGIVYVLQGQTGAVLAQLAIPGGGQGGAPNIADFDGDGRPDIGTAGAVNYVAMRFNGADALELIWRAPTEDDSSSRTGSSVFDFDGDGRAEVIYNDEEFVRIYPGVEPACLETPPGADCDGIMTDAEILFLDLNSSRTRTEYPVIADVNGDFKAEIVFPTSNEATFLDPLLVGDAGIEVWRDRLDNWVPTRPVWNQHSYHITNVGTLGEIPASEPANWSTPADRPFNSYRVNTQGTREDFCAPDLVLKDLVQLVDQCPDLALQVTVVNQGCLGVGPGVVVVFVDEFGTTLGLAVTKGAIAPGTGEVVTSASTSLSGQFSVDVEAIVDDPSFSEGQLNECEEGNNRIGPITASCTFDL